MKTPALFASILLMVLYGIFLPLRADAPAEERTAADKVSQSFKDGAFEITQIFGTAFLKKYPSSELAPQVRLNQAQAAYQLGRSQDAVDVLNLPEAQIPPALLPEFYFWQAESLLDLGKWPEAEQKYRSLLKITTNNPHLEAANLGLAWALFQQNKEAEGDALLKDLIANKGTTPAGLEARLVSAKMAVSKKQFADAAAQLESLLAVPPEPRLKYEAAYWLGESYSALGKNDLAVTAYQQITNEPKAFPKTLVSQAYLGLGAVQQKLAQDDKAMASYQQAYQLTENEKMQLAAFKSYLQAAEKNKQLPDAVTKLYDYVKSNDTARPNALFAIAAALYDDHSDDDKAIGILDTLLVTYDKASWRTAGEDLLGQLYLRTNKNDQAQGAFQACLEANPEPDLARDAHFNLGLILFRQNKFSDAIAQFDKVASGGMDALAQSAAYNLILAETKLNQTDAVTKSMADFTKRFPQSTFRPSLAIAQGDLLATQGKTDDALAAYQSAVVANSSDPNQAVLLRHIADFQYQNNDLEGAAKTYAQIVKQFPDDSLEAAQRGLLASYELKKLSDDQFEAALQDLGQKYGKSQQAAEIFFRLGEYYFYKQDYVKAQSILQQLATTYPESSYADDAQFFAGRAAAAHQDYTSALTLFDKVPDNSPFRPDAQLAEGEVYQQQLQFENALAQYDHVLAAEKSGDRFVEACLRKGECLFAMGAKDNTQFSRAADVYSQILATKEGTIAQRNEAAERKAKCLSELGKTDDALALYLDVLYGRVGGDETTSPPAADFTWQIQSGWEAERIREAQKDWRGAIEIYKRLEQIGGIHQQLFHNLINQLRRDNYIYD